MKINCKALSWNNSILFLGLVVPVLPYTEKREGKIKKCGLFYYCSSEDQHGNKYSIFTDYDPALTISRTVALLTETNKEGRTEK